MALGPEKGKFSVDFIPVFDNRAGSVNTFYLRPSLHRPDGSRFEDAAFLALGAEGKFYDDAFVVFNMGRVIKFGMKKADQLRSEASDAKVIIPVNGAVLARKEIASEFASLCRLASPEKRANVIFEVTNIAGDHRLSLLDDVAIVLHPFCLACHVRVPLSAANLTLYATCNYTGVSVDLLNKPWPMAAVSAHLKAFFGRVELSQLKLYTHGVGNHTLATYLRGIGVRFLSGDGVDEDVLDADSTPVFLD